MEWVFAKMLLTQAPRPQAPQTKLALNVWKWIVKDNFASVSNITFPEFDLDAGYDGGLRSSVESSILSRLRKFLLIVHEFRTFFVWLGTHKIA